jgi:hypothetical protein
MREPRPGVQHTRGLGRIASSRAVGRQWSGVPDLRKEVGQHAEASARGYAT